MAREYPSSLGDGMKAPLFPLTFLDVSADALGANVACRANEVCLRPELFPSAEPFELREAFPQPA